MKIIRRRAIFVGSLPPMSMSASINKISHYIPSKGSSYNVRIDWESGEQTYEPLDVMAKDDPVTCTIYGRNKNLLDEPGWKRFKTIAKREKKMLRQINQAKLRSYRCAPRYKFGYLLPRNYEHAVSIDVSNNNKT